MTQRFNFAKPGTKREDMLHLEPHQKDVMATKLADLLAAEMAKMAGGGDKPVCTGCALSILEDAEVAILRDQGADDEQIAAYMASRAEDFERRALGAFVLHIISIGPADLASMQAASAARN